jgi:hypothetical protein
MTTLHPITIPPHLSMDPILASACPIGYRLIRRRDGNGNMEPVLQGAYLFTVGGRSAHEWRDLKTQDEPYIEDHIPFSNPITQLEALSVTLQRFGRACQVAVDQIVDAFTAVMADEAEQRRQRGPTIGRKRRARRAGGRGRNDG